MFTIIDENYFSVNYAGGKAVHTNTGKHQYLFLPPVCTTNKIVIHRAYRPLLACVFSLFSLCFSVIVSAFRYIVFFVCIIRDADFNSDLYGLPAIICVHRFLFHFVFLSRKYAVVGSWSPYAFKFEVLLSIQMRLKIDMTIITVEC